MMDVETPEAATVNLRFGDAAAAKLCALQAEESNPALKLRLTVSGGGCSGFKYDFSLDESVAEDDVCIANDGATLIVDTISMQYLDGAEIDYQDNASGAQFIIRNPNASHSCGCGNSFSV